MPRLSISLLALAACSGSGSSGARAKAECPAATQLRAWLADLLADGPSDSGFEDVQLAKAPGLPGGEGSFGALVVTIEPCGATGASGRLGDLGCAPGGIRIVERGRLLDPDHAADELAAAVAEVRRAMLVEAPPVTALAPPAGTPPAPHPAELRVALAIDARAPWHELAPIFAALAAAQLPTVQLAFAPEQLRAAAPGPSSIDAELAARDAQHRADFERDPGGTLARNLDDPRPAQLADRVYRDCPAIGQTLADIGNERIVVDPSVGKLGAVASYVPAAVAACDCRIELTAVERLLWRLWGRDLAGNPIAWRDMQTSATVDAPAAATWADVAPKLVRSPGRTGP